MSAAPALAGLLLAAVFAIAGAAKLADLEGSRTAVAAFGVPRRFAAPAGTLLPLWELATAVLLCAGVAGAWEVLVAGAISALALLALFCTAIAASLLRGARPDCHCFGQLHSAQAGPWTLLRNGALLSVAAFVASGGDPLFTAASAAAALAVVMVAIRFSPRRASPRAARGLPPGSEAPPFKLTAGGEAVSLQGLLRRGSPVLLIFTDPDCGPCIALAPRIADWQRAHGAQLEIAAVERREDVAAAYGAAGTPNAVLVASDGTIASEVAAGGPAIEALVASALRGSDPEPLTREPMPGSVSLARRELLVRAGGAWATLAGLAAAPALASHQITLHCRYERCGERCCPKKAKCRRRGGRKVCICPDGRVACRDRCCPETFVCRRIGRRRRRRCVCPEGHIVCSGRCVPARTDPRHCGRCGKECPVGTTCVGGECVHGDGTGTGPDGSGPCRCPRGEACCEGQCTDLNESKANCGECGHACPAGEECCEGRCRSLQEDPKNCGKCGKRCASGQVCSEGECRGRCRKGLTNCHGRCVDVQSDPGNCHRCGAKCTGPFDTGECCNGKCCDINGSTCCGSGCANLALDDQNCGACGNACPAGSFCRFGTCTPF